MQNESNHKITFDTYLKTALFWEGTKLFLTVVYMYKVHADYYIFLSFQQLV